ncbi:MAG: tetratricopeptide repeat protein [Planctomycetaceae bacterium]|nr:tetratricopeptide repeat protein [Planctomycetaceae bacterium]
MNHRRIAVLAAGFAAISLVVAPAAAVAQDGDAPAPATRPADSSPADVDALLESMTPEQLKQFIAEAVTSRLIEERRQVAGEITQGLLYEPKDIKAAKALLEDKPANTQQDNIDRICRAFALVDAPFRKAHSLFAAGKFKEAAEAAKTLADVNRTTYLSAATHWLAAQAMEKSAQVEDAIDFYRAILMNMPDRIGFAAGAGMAAAQCYERGNRFRYATEMYVYCLNNYPLTLGEDQLKLIADKIKEYTELYKDPMNAVATKMGSVRTRLAAADTGPKTRQAESLIVAILDDLIKTAQEQSDQDSSSSSSSSGKQPKEKDKQGQQKGSQSAAGQQPGGQPSSPAQKSMLVPGAVNRPGQLPAVRNTSESGDWSQLPPRKREELDAMMRKVISERYRDLIRDYHSAVAEEGGR